MWVSCLRVWAAQLPYSTPSPPSCPSILPSRQWGELHGVRTIAGAAALGAALFGVHCCLAK